MKKAKILIVNSLAFYLIVNIDQVLNPFKVDNHEKLFWIQLIQLPYYTHSTTPK